jgi:hypothetical protein
MSDKRYEANIIRTTAVEPANNLETTSAPGVWSLDEVMELQKKNKWPTVGNVAIDVDEVFSNFLYTGNGSSSARTFVNGINLADNGGLVWTKMRSEVADHELVSSDSNYLKELKSNSTQQAFNNSISFVANNNGYGFSTANSRWNENTRDMVSWTFRKTPKFFDIVTYSGTGSAQNISHNLGSVPGMIITKRTDDTSDWAVYHRGLDDGTNPETKYLRLDLSTAETANTGYWNDTAPTSTQFTVGVNGTVNTNGATYVAYLFAHNNNDGGFGPDQDADIIKCGNYTGGGATNVSIDLGFEPQWIMIKAASGTTGDWAMFDTMRGIVTDGTDNLLRANETNAEYTSVNYIDVTSTGFKTTVNNNYTNGSGNKYIYMAIRRGPLAQPTSSTGVFQADESPNSNNPRFISGFPVDMGMQRLRTSSGVDGMYITSRLTTNKSLLTGSTNGEASTSTMDMDYMNGFDDDGDSSDNFIAHMWKRAPGYFDVVCYPASSISTLINHNLGVPVEMAWIKSRTSTQAWNVLFYDQLLEGQLNTNNALTSLNSSYTSTATTFKSTLHAANQDYIAYLFATKAGVSKVGTYTGTGSGQNIDCGFSSGAKFVLIKRTDSADNWLVFDTTRGIVSGFDPYLTLNTTDAEVTNQDYVDPYSSGFAVTGANPVGANNGTYIFYAIAT